MLEHLLSRGVNPDLESDAGAPLVWAAGHAQEAAVTVLLQHGANVSNSSFYFVILFLIIVVDWEGWLTPNNVMKYTRLLFLQKFHLFRHQNFISI